MEAVLNTPFYAAQIELIQLLATDLETEELMELRKVLIAFRFKLVEERAERIAKAKDWTAAQINQMWESIIEHLIKPSTQRKQKPNIEYESCFGYPFSISKNKVFFTLFDIKRVIL